MDLWIRSQNEEMIKRANQLKVEIHNKDEYAIVEQATILGKYKTRERAKQVLSEIEKILTPRGVLKLDENVKLEKYKEIQKKHADLMVIPKDVEYIKTADTYLYKMPKE